MALVDFLHNPHASFEQVRLWWIELGTASRPERFGYVLRKASHGFAAQTSYHGASCQRLLSEEWTLVLSEQDPQIYRCICGQNVTGVHYLKHKTNGNILQLGGDCLRKYTFQSELGDEVQTWLAYRRRHLRKNRQCLSCGEFKLPALAPSFKRTCTRCYRAKADLSEQLVNLHLDAKVGKCRKCQHEFIRKEGETWKTLCGRCYHEAKTPVNSPMTGT